MAALNKNKMKQIIKLNLNLDKIDKSLIYLSPKTGAKYLNLSVLMRDGPDQYGNDGFVVQDISKEQKENGMKGPILGNAKLKTFDAPAVSQDDDDIPF
jgi:hypothetical protein